MDEPCSALDPIATGAIEDLMQEIKSQYTIVIVTHNMQQATRVSDRTAFFSVLRNEKSDTRTGVLVEYDRTAADLPGPARQPHPGLRHRPDGLSRATLSHGVSTGHDVTALDVSSWRSGWADRTPHGRHVDVVVISQRVGLLPWSGELAPACRGQAGGGWADAGQEAGQR